MAISLTTIDKTLLGNVTGSTGMYTGANVDSLLSDLITKVEAKLTSAMHYKGTVAAYANLPSDAEEGDVYNVQATGKNYAWDSNTEAWDELSGVMDLSAYKTDAENELKYLQIANLATAGANVGFLTSTQINTAIATAFTDYGFGSLAKKSSVAEGDLETALKTKINGKADQTDLTNLSNSLANYQLSSALGTLAFKSAVGYDDFSSTLKTAFDAKAASADLTTLAGRVTDAETTISSHTTSISNLTSTFNNYTTTANLGVLALLTEAQAKAKLNEWGYGSNDDIDAVEDRLDAIAGVTMPTKSTVTIYELWEVVNSIVAGAAEPAS